MKLVKSFISSMNNTYSYLAMDKTTKAYVISEFASSEIESYTKMFTFMLRRTKVWTQKLIPPIGVENR